MWTELRLPIPCGPCCTESSETTRWIGHSGNYNTVQKSWATAKMTARCALYMGAPQIFGCPWVHQWVLFPKFLVGFCSDRSYECAYKIWGSWDNRGTQKFWHFLDTPTFPLCKIFNGLLFWWTLWMHRPNLKSVALPFPEIIRGT